jgi:hypothetical protein
MVTAGMVGAAGGSVAKLVGFRMGWFSWHSREVFPTVRPN